VISLPFSPHRTEYSISAPYRRRRAEKGSQMSTSKRRAALAAFPVALGLMLAGPAVGTASAAPQSDSTVQARHCLLLCVGPHHHHGHVGVGLHLGLWLHL